MIMTNDRQPMISYSITLSVFIMEILMTYFFKVKATRTHRSTWPYDHWNSLELPVVIWPRWPWVRLTAWVSC